MASFQEHVDKAKSNLTFLGQINANVPNFIDWQITACFYVVVHLANAHVVSCEKNFYRTHNEVKNSLNPYNATAGSKVDEKAFLAYSKLRDLSRRSRYMVSDDNDNKNPAAFLVHEIHLAKSLRHLETFLIFFSNEYKITFPKIHVTCNGLKQHEVKNFTVIS